MNETGPGELCILIADAVKKIRNKLKFSTDLLPEPDHWLCFIIGISVWRKHPLYS